MTAKASTVIEPLIKRKIFTTEEEAVRELLRDYILRQIADLQQTTERFRQKYEMDFHQFSEYLHERSGLLENGSLSQEQRQVLGRAIMEEEDDWLEWKAAQEMLENWIGIRQEVAA
jgi:hypothetical protein